MGCSRRSPRIGKSWRTMAPHSRGHPHLASAGLRCPGRVGGHARGHPSAACTARAGSRRTNWPVLAAAGAMVFIPWFEGFGIPLLEAFAAGTPTIHSNRTSLPEVAGGAGLEVDPGNTSTVVEALLRIEQEPALGRALIEKGQSPGRGVQLGTNLRPALGLPGQGRSRSGIGARCERAGTRGAMSVKGIGAPWGSGPVGSRGR